MFNFVGVESATHMAEEIEGAARVIPRSMLFSTTINGVTGFAMLIAVLFVLGDVEAALNTPTQYPFMEIIYNAVKSKQNATAMIIITWSAMLFATIGSLATASRMLWAFARERAVPGHTYISRVHPKLPLPLVSISVITAIAMALSLINIGSNEAFQPFTSLSIAAFYSAYMIAAGAILYRQLTGTMSVRWGPFRLGRASVPTNIFSLAYSAVAWIFAFFPQIRDPSAEEMNWSIVVFSGALIVALVYWVVSARHAYTGPRVEISVEDIKLRKGAIPGFVLGINEDAPHQGKGKARTSGTSGQGLQIMASVIADESRPSKRARLLDEIDSSESQGEENTANRDDHPPILKINDEYARRFEHNKKREEQHRLEEKHGAQSKFQDAGGVSSSDSDSESESEDEGELATEKVDAEILDTLKAIRAKDPRVYDKNVKFYAENEDDEEAEEPKIKKEKPIHLRDYHRQKLLEGNSRGDGHHYTADSPERGNQDLVRSIHTAADQEDGDSSSEEGEFLQAKPKEAQPREQIPAAIPDVSRADDDPEKFLTDFVTSRAWAESNGAPFAPIESDDDDEDARAEAFEHAYNMRFEDPARANEKIMTHSRLATEAQSVRKRESKGRKRTRETEKAERDAAKRKEEKEKRRLRALKIDEAQEKLRQFKEAAGMRNQSVTMEEWSKFLNAGWDSNKWDEEMAKKFDDQYYEEEDDDNIGEGSQDYGGAKKKHLKKPKWNDDIDIGDIDPKFDDEHKAKGLSLSDEDDEGDDGEDSGGISLEANQVADAQQDLDGDFNQSKKSHKQSHRQERQERKKIEELVDQRMVTEGPSGTSKQSGPFRYRATSPSSFGLSAREILMADDSQLNQHAGLKKLASFRDPDKKHSDHRKLSKRARLRQWRKDTFGDEDGPPTPFQEYLKTRMQAVGAKASAPTQNGPPREEDNEVKKKKKKKRSRKRKADQSDQGIAAGQGEGDQSASNTYDH